MTTTLQDAPAVTESKVTLRFTRCQAAPTTSSLGAQLGYFEEEFRDEPGISLSLASLSLDPKLNPTRAEQFSLRHAGTKSAWARAQGAKLRVVALSHLKSHFSLWALESSGLHYPTDLKGRRVAVLRSLEEETLDLSRSGSLRAYEGALRTAGLELSDVELVDVPVPKVHFSSNDNPSQRRAQFNRTNRELLFRLIRNEADVITGNFSQETSDLIGLTRVFDSRTSRHPAANPPALRALVVHETLLEEKFDWVVRILARHLQAAAWANEHPKEAAELVAQDHLTSPDVLVVRYPNLIEGLQLDLAPDKIQTLTEQKDFYLRHGFIAADIDVDAWVDHRPLEAAKALFQKRGFAL